jgi:DNA-binding winged helix-turn-helix (wHTH) protein
MGTNTVRFGSFEVQPEARQLLVNGVPARLGARAFDVLLALIERRDRVVGKNELLDLVWPGLIVEENNLQVHISALRKLLGPRALATIPGRGYRFTALLGTDEAVPVAAATSAAIPHSLPLQRTRFIGRERELAELRAMLAGGARLVTVTGAGGSGKTRLALQVAAGLLDDARGGVIFVPLAPVQEPGLVAATIALAAGVRDLKELRDRDAL